MAFSDSTWFAGGLGSSGSVSVFGPLVVPVAVALGDDPPPNRQEPQAARRTATGVRNPTLHDLLQSFTQDAATRLELAADGDEIPFELVQEDRGRVPLYCYRPLTSAFIRSHLGLLVALPTYAPAAQALEGAIGVEAYLRVRGERPPPGRRERADAALRCLLARVFEERSEFGFDEERFRHAYDELERSLYEGRCMVEVAAELQGLELDPQTRELALGDGLSLTVPGAIAEPPLEHGLLLVLRTTQEPAAPPPLAVAAARFRQLLTALQLFESGRRAVSPVGWSRVDGGPWTPISLAVGGGYSGEQRLPSPRIDRDQEDELRGFCNLIARRLPSPAPDNSGAGELAWALARFELGSERASPLEALTDYLLALRALLEPEGPASGRLAQRLAVICARPGERGALAERTAHAISLERAVIAGLAPAGPGAGELVAELAEHLRAILRDVLCGYLDCDVRAVADGLLAEAADAVEI